MNKNTSNRQNIQKSVPTCWSKANPMLVMRKVQVTHLSQFFTPRSLFSKRAQAKETKGDHFCKNNSQEAGWRTAQEKLKSCVSSAYSRLLPSHLWATLFSYFVLFLVFQKLSTRLRTTRQKQLRQRWDCCRIRCH